MASGNRSPREEGELEDGEICDDDTEENVRVELLGGSRPSVESCRRPPNHQHSHNLMPLMAHPPPDFRHLTPFDFGPHLLGAFPPSHRQQCGPSGPDRPPPPGLSPLHRDSNQRSSFWERSHNALDRFRHRALPPGGRDDWSRGMWDEDAGANMRPPCERYGPGELHSNKKESPQRKRILVITYVQGNLHFKMKVLLDNETYLLSRFGCPNKNHYQGFSCFYVCIYILTL